MHRYIPVAMAVGLAAFLLGCQHGTEGGSGPAGVSALWTSAPVNLPVVRTFGELVNQRAIDIGDGISVRLGVSASHASLNAGVLIYCMSDGYDAMQAHETNPDRLGPLWVSTRRGEQSLDWKHTTPCISRWRWQTTRGCTLLYARGLVIDKPGDYEVSIRTEAGKVIAQTTIKSDNDFYHPWTPFVMHEEGEWEWISRTDYTFKQTKFAKMSLGGVGLALPDRHGDHFEVVAGDAVLVSKREHFEPAKPATPLPALIPETPTPDFRLSRQDDLLFIDSKERIESFRLDWYCLARLWVNDRPFVPRSGHVESVLNGGTVHFDTRVGFHLAMDPKAIGAAPGDRIGLQVLFCPAWRYVENPTTMESASSGPARLTNRVEWVVR